MNNPFATVPTPAQQPQANPFATQVPTPQHTPSFPTTAPTANPFAAVVQAPPPAPPPTQGVAAIQAAFAFPPLNPPGEAGLGLQTITPPNTPPALADHTAAVADALHAQAPEPAPKARRSRKPKADVQGDIDAALLRDDVQGAIDAARTEPEPLLDPDAGAPTLDSATTEELRDALNARGWNVTLVAS